MTKQLALLSGFLMLAACADSIDTQSKDKDGDHRNGPSLITTTDNGDGTFTTVVNATSEEKWVYFDYDTTKEVEGPTEAHGAPYAALHDGEHHDEHEGTWDVAFQRFKVKTNSGFSGEGKVEVAILDGVDFAKVTKAPVSGYIVDQEKSDDPESKDPGFAFLLQGGWYDYSITSHTLTPKNRVYVVKSESAYFKVKFLAYYDDAGTPGYPTFQWGRISPPDIEGGITIAASDANSWVYFNVAQGKVVSVSDPSTSKAWDLGFSRTRVITNSGTSGSGFGGARSAPNGTLYDDLTESSTVGFEVDEMLPSAVPGGTEFSGNPVLNEWYNYDGATHKVSTKNAVYLVRTASGDYAKFMITDWSDGLFTILAEPVSRKVTVQTTTLTTGASGSAEFVYFNMRLGKIVEPEVPADSFDWDLAVRRTVMATNSGTSGPGNGGAYDPSVTNLAALTEAVTAGYSADVTTSGMSKNTVLDNDSNTGWYTYDHMTHLVTPNDKAFLLKTADEGYVKLKVTGWNKDTGAVTFDWAYAGAGKTAF